MLADSEMFPCSERLGCVKRQPSISCAMISKKSNTHPGSREQGSLFDCFWCFCWGRSVEVAILTVSVNEYVSTRLHRPYCRQLVLFNSLQHAAGPLAFGLHEKSRSCVKLVGVKGGLRKMVVCLKVGSCKSWFT